MLKYVTVIKPLITAALLLFAFSTFVFARDHITAYSYAELSDRIRYFEDNNLDSSFYYANQLLAVSGELEAEEQAAAYLLIGEIHDNASLHESAITYFSKALRMNLLDEDQQLYVWSELLELYTSRRDQAMAQAYLSKLQRKVQETDIAAPILAEIYFDYGTYYWFFGQYDSAIYNLKTAATLVKNTLPIDYERLVMIQSELSEAYSLREDYADAQRVIDECYSYPGFNSLSQYAQNYPYFEQGLIYLGQKRYKEAQSIFEDILTVCDEIGLVEEKINVLGWLIEVANETNDLEAENTLLKERRAAEIQMLNQASQRRIEVLEIEYGVFERETTLALQRRELQQSRTTILVISGCLLAFAGLLIGLIFLYRKNVKVSTALADRNNQVETLMRELHHRVKNNLQVVSSLLGLQSRRLEDSAAKDAVEDSRSRVQAMSLIHQLLYRHDDISFIDIGEYLRKLTAEIVTIFGLANKVHVDLDVADGKWDIDTALPIGLLVNELMINSLKHAQVHDEILAIKIQLVEEDDLVRLIVRDNGTNANAMFAMKQGESFGKRLIQLLVEQMKGDLKMEVDQGLRYEINLKKAS